MINIYEKLDNNAIDNIRYAVLKQGLKDIAKCNNVENPCIIINNLLIWGWKPSNTLLMIQECYKRRWHYKLNKIIKEVEKLRVNLEEFYNELLEVDKAIKNVSRETKSTVDEIEEKLAEETNGDEENGEEENADETNGDEENADNE